MLGKTAQEPQSDLYIYDKNVLQAGGRKLPLRATVAVIAGLIVVSSVLVELVPTTSLWLNTVNTLSDTALGSLNSEAEMFRASIVGRTLERVNNQINFPVHISSVLLGLNGAFPARGLRTGTAEALLETFRPRFHDVGRLFPTLTVVGMAWVNDRGMHGIFDKYTGNSCGIFDSKTSPNLIWYSYNETGNGLNSTIVENSKNWNMVERSWWVRSQHNVVDGMAWTGPYWSVSPGDGFVLAFTRQVADPDNPTGPSVGVILIAYSVQYLVNYFSDLRHTAHGWSMLLNWNMEMIAATSGYPSADPKTMAAYKATASPNATVREIVAEWAGHSGPAGLTALSFELGDLCVDTALITQPGNLTFWLVLVTPKSDFLGDVVQKQVDTKSSVVRIVIILLVVEIVVMAISVMLAAFLGDRLVKPLFLVSAQMKKVANMELTGIVGTDSAHRSTIQEVYMLESEAARMGSVLGAFSLYVPTIVVRYLIKNKLRPSVGVRPAHATILFLDIANFTASMDKHGATVLIEILERMFDSFSYILESNGAIIDKYIGDAIMALWGCPESIESSEKLACKATIELLASLEKMNEEIFVRQHGMSMAIRVGLNSGEVYAGNVGSSSRLNYTVLGNAVNLAARLEPLNKEFNTTVCVTDAIRTACEDQYAFRCLGRVMVRGFAEPVKVHELMGAIGDLSPVAAQMYENFKSIDQKLYHGDRRLTATFDDYIVRNPEDETAVAIKHMLRKEKGMHVGMESGETTQ
eukprot:m51a1_g2787 putative adenylate guanylate cyclase (750) ;mRNA; f:25569-28025